jgi:hypothetical protein
MKRHGRARLRPSRGWRVGLGSDGGLALPGASPYRGACGICALV